MESSWTQLIVMLGSIGTGAFGLFKYMVKKHDEIVKASNKQVSELQDKFLEHLSRKNGHLERATEKFDTTVNTFNKTITNLTVELKRDNDYHKKYGRKRN